jgi:hypothetical protein
MKVSIPTKHIERIITRREQYNLMRSVYYSMAQRKKKLKITDIDLTIMQLEGLHLEDCMVRMLKDIVNDI